MNPRIPTLIALTLLCLAPALATDYLDAYTSTTNDFPQTRMQGYTINITMPTGTPPFYFEGINVTTGSTAATNCLIYYNTNNSLLGTGIISGSYCDVSELNLPATNNTLYDVIIGKNGSSYTSKYGACGLSFPITHSHTKILNQRWLDWPSTWGSAGSCDYNINGIVLRDNAGTIPQITQNTYNLTSAYQNNTAWRTDTTYPIPTIDTTPTITFDTNINAYCRIHTSDQNWTTMGDSRNCTTTGTTSHTCTLGAADAFSYSQTPQELYLSCIDTTYTLENATSSSGPLNITVSGVSESEGRTAILAGLDTSEISGNYNTYTDHQLAIRLANTSQYQGTFDLFIESGNKRWAFNYDPITDSNFPAMANITGVFWFWEDYILTPTDITNQVSTLINATN